MKALLLLLCWHFMGWLLAKGWIIFNKPSITTCFTDLKSWWQISFIQSFTVQQWSVESANHGVYDLYTLMLFTFLALSGLILNKHAIHSYDLFIKGYDLSHLTAIEWFWERGGVHSRQIANHMVNREINN